MMNDEQLQSFGARAGIRFEALRVVALWGWLAALGAVALGSWALIRLFR